MKNFWTIAGFELRKICRRKIVWIAFGMVFLTMLAAGVHRAFVSFEVNGVRISVWEKLMQDKAEIKKISGRTVDDKLLEEALAANNSTVYRDFYDDIVKDLVSLPSGEDSVEEQIAEEKAALGIRAEEELLYGARRLRIEKGMDVQQLTDKEKNYWREVLAQEELPWNYEYTVGMTQTWVTAYTAIVLVALMLAVSLANLFADEHQRKTDQLLLCSRNGKTVLYRAKITAGMLFTAVSTLLVLLVTAVPQLIMFGADAWNSPIQLFAPTSMLQMTFGEMIIYTYVLAMIAAFLYASISMCCSELFRNSTVAVMALIVVLVLVPMMVMVPYEYRVVSQIFDLNPINVLAIWSAADYRLVPFFRSYLTVHQVAPVLYVVLIMAFVVIGSRAFKKYQVSGR